MSKPQKSSTRSWARMPLIRACLAIALVVPASPLVADSDQGVVRKCGGLSTGATSDASAFPQPVVRESRDGILRTTLHACISTKEMLDHNAYRLKPGDSLPLEPLRWSPAKLSPERSARSVRRYRSSHKTETGPV